MGHINIFNSSVLKHIIKLNVFLLYHSFKLTWSGSTDRSATSCIKSQRGHRSVSNQSPISRRPTAKPSCDSSAIGLNFGRGEVTERLQCMSD